MNNYKMNEHAGTHIDAPTHFNKHGWDPSEIPLDHLVDLPAVVIDITERAITDPHAQLLVGKSVYLFRQGVLNFMVPLITFYVCTL